MKDDVVIRIMGIGDVCLETSTKYQLLLKNVRYTPDIQLHLIFIKVFDNKDYHNHFGEGKWKLIKSSLIIVRVKKSNILYMIQTKLYKEIDIAENFSNEL